MKFSLAIKIDTDGGAMALADIRANAADHADLMKDISAVEGALVVTVDGQSYCEDLMEPIFRVAGTFIGKVRWVLGGDTETVPFRNSEHCFALAPAGESVELAFFVGNEMEVEEYVLDPTNIPFDVFVPVAISAMQELADLGAKLSPNSRDNEDYSDLLVSLDETKAAWKDYQLHRR